ncbi:uncharacterized protein RHOBADRAFT_39615 [Rhodotorula graminis WP1]|uniref:Lysophospholipase NTE1 n=1 Tax=Rhodotorula graminis (strain WP1) TaxID=578459 RepID=A0A0P9EFL8_RHOGW|nr:uncharacterized protein RHOBADRAFT_39615 [Rhodotorula graminis WP1]KPV72156.1 hypothetical protein RHOBADRAFT_39615 [Rhodotorula graminis WP1]
MTPRGDGSRSLASSSLASAQTAPAAAQRRSYKPTRARHGLCGARVSRARPRGPVQPRVALRRLGSPHGHRLGAHTLPRALTHRAHLTLPLARQSTRVLAFATLTVPTALFSLLHYSASLTFHLTFVKILAFLLILTTIVSWIYKVRYLNRYTQLRDLPGGSRIKGDEGFDLHPDLATDQAPNGFHNYLDEFLSAIKVFGYLEKPVFHELARHLQTRRLVAGDTLDLAKDKSFYIVVDGSVEVYARNPSDKTGGSSASPADDGYATDDDEGGKGWQLLNNVESGGTLSSLFTILSLFTEDVKLRYEEDGQPGDDSSDDGMGPHHRPDADPLVAHLAPRDADPVDARQRERRRHAPPVPVAPDGAPAPALARRTPSALRRPQAVGEATIARAATDTTLAVIPAEAFRRLTKKFPNAAAHIVQVILTRLQRVTFLTAHKYLGLTREVIRTEQAINDLACYPLPSAFWESGGIQRLRARFVPETKLNGPGADGDSGDEGEHDDYFSIGRRLASAGSGGKRGGARSGGGGGGGAAAAAGAKGRRAVAGGAGRRSNVPLETPYAGPRMGDAGDLLTMSAVTDGLRGVGSPVVQTPRLERLKSTAVGGGGGAGGGAGGGTTSSGEGTEFDLRGAVMESISKAIGLVQPHVAASSVEASPLVRATEHHSRPSGLRDQAAFNSSFGSLSFLGLQGLHDDESSVSSASASALSALGTHGGHGGAQSFASMDLENEVEILYFPKGSVLVKEGERNAGLYFVIEGFLDVSMPEAESTLSSKGRTAEQRRDDANKAASAGPAPAASTVPPAPPPKPKSIPLFTVRPGGIAGYLSSLSGFPSYVDIVAKTECYVGFLPAKALERIMDRKPIVLLTLAKRLISLLSPLVLHIDSALDWMHVSAGQVIYRQDDDADSFYIVINGRLRSIVDRQGGGVSIQAEHGQGESVGELDCITASPRPSTLHAIRDTELARMPMTLFNAISVRHPLVTIQISRIIAARLRSQVAREARMVGGLPKELGAPGMGDGSMGKNNFNLKTVAIIPTNRHVPISEFAIKLHQALESIGAPTSYLNQATVMQVLGRHAFSRMGQLKLAGWLAETEQKYRIILYVADTAVSAPWTQTCIRQADCIMVVADGGADPELGEHEKLLVGMKTTARKELVLLHAERNVVPGTTRRWLKNRSWVHAHHHVEMLGATPEVDRSSVDDPAAVVALRKIAARVELQINKYKKVGPRPAPSRAPAQSDFARLARRLCGKSIGLVLGGGGARGISHLGALQALQERSIPIDMVGGTSIGAFVGGLYAREGDLVSAYGRAKRFSGRMSTLWRILTDLTYPVVAYTTGHEFNRGIYKSFYGTHIEDMWIPFFCNTTNITHSRMDVHTSGYAWRYVRASMSLAGLLPPLCDEGDMLVDGGYVDNLPVSVMLAQGAASVFAVDVGSVDDTSPRNYGESVSGWWLLIQRWNPFGKAPNVPSITEIQARLTYVSSVKTLEEAKATPGVLYMRMPVTQFGTMEFKRFPEILGAGLEFANELLDEWRDKGELPTGMEGDGEPVKKQKRGQSIRRNSI